MRGNLIGIALIVAGAAGPALAQSDPVGVCVDVRGCTPGSSGGGSSNDYPTLFGSRPLIDDLKGLFGGGDKASSSRPGYDANEQGVAVYNNGDWAGAVALFQNALAYEPDNQTFQKNLANARQQLSKAQANLERERQEQEAAQRSKAAADNIQRTIQSYAGTVGSAPAAGGNDGGGLDFSTAVAVAGPKPASPAVRPAGGLPKDKEDAIAVAFRDAPPGVMDRVRKGFQAVMTRDWKVATAWFQDALNRDPNNAGLKRMVALSQYTLPVKPAATSTALQLPTDADMDLLFLPEKAPASAVTGRPPSQAAIDEYFHNLGKGGSYKPSNELRLYLNGMPKEDYNRRANLPPPSVPAPVAVPAQRPGIPATYIPPGQRRDDFMMDVLMDDMMGVEPLPANVGLIKLYQWEDMGRLMYRMAHEPADPALQALVKKYLQQSP